MINFLILGHGAVGLSLGALLHAFRCVDWKVSFLLKEGSRLEDYLPISISLDKYNISLQSNLFKPIAAAPQADVLIVALKAYDLEKSLKDILHLLSENTLVLPVLNGLEHAAFIKKIYPCLKVFESSIYISCEKDAGKVINYTYPPKLVISKSEISDCYLSNPLFFSIDDLAELLSKSGMRCVLTRNSRKESWRKFIITSSVNGACLFFNQNLGEVVKREASRSFLTSCLIEGIQVAERYSVIFSIDEQSEMINLVYSMSPNCIPSMLLDYRNQKQTEVDFLNGKICSLAQAKRIKTPSNSAVTDYLRGEKSCI